VPSVKIISAAKTILEKSVGELASIFETVADTDYLALFIENVLPDPLAASVLNSVNLSVNKAASILNSSYLSADKAALILNSTNISANRAASILDNPNISPDKVASICDSPNITSSRLKSILDTGIITYPDKLAAILDGDSLTADDAASHIESGIYGVSLYASAFNSTYLSADKVASILNSTNISADKAASIINSANMGVDRAATILSSTSISASKVGDILASLNLALSKLRNIVSSTSWTRTTVFMELMLDDPVAAGRATYNETAAKFSYTYDSANLRGHITFPAATLLEPGAYAQLNFGTVSLNAGDIVVFRRYHNRDPSGGGWWYVRLLVSSTEIFSRDVGPDSKQEYGHKKKITSALSGDLIWRLINGSSSVLSNYSMDEALCVLLVIR